MLPACGRSGSSARPLTMPQNRLPSRRRNWSQSRLAVLGTGEQDRDRIADQRPFRVAEQLVEAAVGRDDAALAHVDDAEHHVVEERVLLRQQRLDPHLVVLALADVGDDAVDPVGTVAAEVDRLAAFHHPALDAAGVDDAVFDFVGAPGGQRRLDLLAPRAPVLRADDAGPALAAGVDEHGGRVAADVADGVADEIDGAVGARAEHRARDLGHDAAEAFFAPADVLEQLADRDAHALELASQAAQLVVRGQRQRGVEAAACKVVGKAHQRAQRRHQAALEQQHEQQQRHRHLPGQHHRVAPLLGAQLLLAVAVVHLDQHPSDRLAAHHDLALAAQQPAGRPDGRVAVDDIGVVLGAYAHVHHGRVAHQRIDQRARRIGIHVPQRLLHAQRQDVGIALQILLQTAARRLLFLHAEQQVAAEGSRDGQAAERHQQQRAVQRTAIQLAQADRQLRGNKFGEESRDRHETPGRTHRRPQRDGKSISM